MDDDDKFDQLKKALDKINPAEFEWTSDGVIAQEIGEITDDISITSESESITIDLSSIMNNISISTMGTPGCNNTAIGYQAGYIVGTGSPYWSSSINNGLNGTSYSTSPASSTLEVHGDANFDGDIKWKGRSLVKLLESIEDRLAILQPDLEKLEHFEALKKAYEHYKTLEALCSLPVKEEPK